MAGTLAQSPDCDEARRPAVPKMRRERFSLIPTWDYHLARPLRQHPFEGRIGTDGVLRFSDRVLAVLQIQAPLALLPRPLGGGWRDFDRQLGMRPRSLGPRVVEAPTSLATGLVARGAPPATRRTALRAP